MSKFKRKTLTNRGRSVLSTENDLRDQQVTQTSPGDLHRHPVISIPWVTRTGRELFGSNEYTQEHPRLAQRNDSVVPEPDVSLVTSAYAQPTETIGSYLEAPDSEARTKRGRRPKVPGPTCGAHVMTYAIEAWGRRVTVGHIYTWQSYAHASSRRRWLV